MDFQSSFCNLHGVEGVDISTLFAGGFDADCWSNHPKYLCGGKRQEELGLRTYSLSEQGISHMHSYAACVKIREPVELSP